MVEITQTIPTKEATMIQVPTARPSIIGEPGFEAIMFGGIETPKPLNKRLLNKCGVDIRASNEGLATREVEERVQEGASKRNLYMRFAGEKPLSVVTDVFKEISAEDIVAKATAVMGTNPMIRYFKNNESLQLNFPVESRFPGLNLVVNTGPYGVYGGSGTNAVSYGVSWFNDICTNWTIFLDRAIRDGIGRIPHRGNSPLEVQLENMLVLMDELEGKIEDSHQKYFSFPELDQYFTQYERSRNLNKKITKQIREKNPLGMSVYDLSYRLTELCQDEKLSDVSRAKIEYMAGEVILCYDKIKDKLFAEPRQRRGGFRRSVMPLNYVNLN